jgi:hypothetical protein
MKDYSYTKYSQSKSYSRTYSLSSVSYQPIKNYNNYPKTSYGVNLKSYSSPVSYPSKSTTSSTSYNPIYPSESPPYKSPPIIPPPLPRTPITNFGRDYHFPKPTKGTLGYETYIKSFGKILRLPGIRSKGNALKFGETKVLSGKRALSATFFVKPTKVMVSDTTNYRPSDKLFREYKIKKGKKISLMDMFIQRRGKRLVTGSEISALKQARRKKNG